MGERDRRWGRTPGLTLVGEGTRDALREIAVRFIARRGYARTTLRAIAKELRVSPSLLYRYYPSKSRMLLEHCDELARDLFDRSICMPRGCWSARFVFLVRESFRLLRDQRLLAIALLEALLDHGDATRPLGVSAAAGDVRRIFELAIVDADDAPRVEAVKPLTGLLLRTYLGLVVGWLLDDSVGQRDTYIFLRSVDVAALARFVGV